MNPSGQGIETPISRNQWLDGLRGIAILLVLFNHADLDTTIGGFGWLGVDLFFVLSGYLISHLLFLEFIKNGKINFRRFIWRRSLRIMPAFYIFMIVSLAYGTLLSGHLFTYKQVLAELFYVQNYLPGIWVHTWSLAVEEQFYISFVMVLLLLIKARAANKPGLLLTFFGISWLAIVLLKFQAVYVNVDAEEYFFVETHLRAEGIVLGVVLGCLQAFYPRHIELKSAAHKLVIVLVILALIPLFIWEGGSFYMNTWGLSLVNLAFAGLVLLSIQNRSGKATDGLVFNSNLMRPVAWIGLHSYSIYLWHLNVRGVTRDLFSAHSLLGVLLYFGLAVVMGVLASVLVDQPIQRWRNRLWPKSI